MLRVQSSIMNKDSKGVRIRNSGSFSITKALVRIDSHCVPLFIKPLSIILYGVRSLIFDFIILPPPNFISLRK